LTSARLLAWSCRLSRELGYAISLWSHPVMKQVYIVLCGSIRFPD
jgi:hypothetical protein